MYQGFITKKMVSNVLAPCVMWDAFYDQPNMIGQHCSISKTIQIPRLKAKLYLAIYESTGSKDQIPSTSIREDNDKRISMTAVYKQLLLTKPKMMRDNHL
jgi:hypothetical protein